MDLVQATGNGGLPNNTLSNSGSAPVGDAKGDYDWGLVIHMALMLAAFVFLFPMGYLLLRYLDSVNYHRWMQSTAIIVVLFGVGAGVYESKLYNKVRKLCIPSKDDDLLRIKSYSPSPSILVIKS